jgi:hypothetical protein
MKKIYPPNYKSIQCKIIDLQFIFKMWSHVYCWNFFKYFLLLNLFNKKLNYINSFIYDIPFPTNIHKFNIGLRYLINNSLTWVTQESFNLMIFSKLIPMDHWYPFSSIVMKVHDCPFFNHNLDFYWNFLNIW